MKRFKTIWKNYKCVLFFGISVSEFINHDWILGGLFFIIAMFTIPDFEDEEI
jgi:hypothetical protein